MTVAHKNLTGTDLHEPKGVAAAAANKVYVSDGAGSGTWQKLSSSQLDSTANPFGAALFHIQNQQTSGTQGQAISGSTWTAFVLNTSVTNEIASASLGSNQITLPAGTYFIDAVVTMTQNEDDHKQRAKLYNVTDAADTLLGMYAGGYTAVGGTSITVANGSNRPTVKGRFTIAGSKVFELRVYSAGTGSTGGEAMSIGTEIYADVLIWKV